MNATTILPCSNDRTMRYDSHLAKIASRWGSRTACFLGFGLFGFLPNTTQAQQASASVQISSGAQPVVVIGEPARHATSARECDLRGQADVLRSRGLYNLWTSQAQVQQQQAEALAIQNQRYREERKERLTERQQELKRQALEQ